MKIINVFCDASIDNKSHTACGGCTVVSQVIDENNMVHLRHEYNSCYIQTNATNNSAEILAIWRGIQQILFLRQRNPDAIFRLFSDSKISLYGLRDWIKNWVLNIDPMDNDRILKSSSGQPVANQQYFIDIFNIIVENDLHVELYHQRGHVTENGKRGYDKARASFVKANKVAPESLGLDIQIVSYYNNLIDEYTRSSLYSFVDNNVLLEGVEIEPMDPLYHYIISDQLSKYISCIDKTSVRSRHNFKGGYNQ